METVFRSHSFRWKDEPGAGFGFELGEDGKVPADMCDTAAENYYLALTGQMPGLEDKGIETWTNRYREPSIGKCHCGEEVALGNFTNTCPKCGRDYNFSGQELAPREQWGEETGETAVDIINYDGVSEVVY